jgi:hypothetical protein
MTLKSDILARLAGEGGAGTLYLPDLSLWYDWHQRQGTLPERWQGYSLPQVAQALGAPVWLVVRPWQTQTPGVEVVTTEQAGERRIESRTSAGTLTARWIVGPDGQWWQTEYPVKSEADLAAALELAQARTYVLDDSRLAQGEALVGEAGVLALELPRRPYSDLLHEFLGWGEGLLLLAEPAVAQMVAVLETRLQDLAQAVAHLPGRVVLSPDNLDGQFISPAVFRQYLDESYRTTAALLHEQDKRLIVHLGGPVRRILAALAATGVDGVEGIAGPPHSDLSLAQARELAGPDLSLWGGVPQDFLFEAHDRASFEAAAVQAAREARQDSRMLVGLADRVPIEADLGRLEAMPALIEQSIRGD